MTEKPRHPIVGDLRMAMPWAIGLFLFLIMLVIVDLTMEGPMVYGGNLCKETESMVAVCPVPPVGLFIAAGVALAATVAIMDRYRERDRDE